MNLNYFSGERFETIFMHNIKCLRAVVGALDLWPETDNISESAFFIAYFECNAVLHNNLQYALLHPSNDDDVLTRFTVQ